MRNFFLLKKRIQHSCFPVYFVKFLRNFLQSTSVVCSCIIRVVFLLHLFGFFSASFCKTSVSYCRILFSFERGLLELACDLWRFFQFFISKTRLILFCSFLTLLLSRSKCNWAIYSSCIIKVMVITFLS